MARVNGDVPHEAYIVRRLCFYSSVIFIVCSFMCSDALIKLKINVWLTAPKEGHTGTLMVNNIQLGSYLIEQ